MSIPTFFNIIPEEMKAFQQKNREHDYALIDVRQEAEYQSVHIPGAKLIPLDLLEDRMDELPRDREIFFYCRSGVRSQAACISALSSDHSFKKITNMTGGILAWQGHALTGMPKIEVFQNDLSESRLLFKSMDLEKAAEQFYEYLLQHHPDPRYIDAVTQLANAEVAHAKTIYEYWKHTVDDPTPFEILYQGLGGEILEGGEPLEQAISRIDSGESKTCMNLMEMALIIELSAYDLYRSMADQHEDASARQAFLHLAQMEKNHIQTVADIMPLCLEIDKEQAEE